MFNTLLSAANKQIAAAGLTAPELTIENYAEVLDSLIGSLSDENAKALAEQTARDTVTATVESQRELIRQGVENAVRKQVTEAVLAAAGLSMTSDQYDAAVAAGQISDEVQAQVSAGVSTQMNAMQGTVDSNTEAQIQSIIEENMNSEQVQSQISEGVQRAAGGRASLQALKQQLDSYNTFYNGILSYTEGVDRANSGAKEILSGTYAVRSGSGELASGSAQLKDGTNQLNSGASQLKDGSAALNDGISQLRDGSSKLAAGTGELSDGAARLSDGSGELYDGIGTLRGKRLGVFKRKNRLRNIVLRKPLRVTNGCVTQNEDRQLDAGRADLDALVDIADRKKVRAEPFIYIGKLRRAVTVAVRLDDAAQLGGVADLFFDFQKIMNP